MNPRKKGGHKTPGVRNADAVWLRSGLSSKRREMTEKRICFYHTDNDGYCSAAIVARHYSWELELYPIDYGHDFPWDKIDVETDVIMVNFSLQPFPQMLKLSDTCKSLLWIDHHKPAIIDYRQWAASTGLRIEGAKRHGEATCELAWYHYCPTEEMPSTVDYLGQYNRRHGTWKWSDWTGVLEFEWGLRTVQYVSPVEPQARALWDVLLGDSTYIQDCVVDRLICDGEVVLAHVKKQHEQIAKNGCFLTSLDGAPMIACNVAGADSHLFDSVIDDFPEAVGLLTFVYRRGKWAISMYQIPRRDTLDLGALAKKFGTTTQQGEGGGGHPDAGFQWRSGELPFKETREEAYKIATQEEEPTKSRFWKVIVCYMSQHWCPLYFRSSSKEKVEKHMEESPDEPKRWHHYFILDLGCGPLDSVEALDVEEL